MTRVRIGLPSAGTESADVSCTVRYSDRAMICFITSLAPA